MAKENNKTIITLVSFAVLFILGSVFIASIAGQTLLNTQKTSVADESYNLNTISCYSNGQVNTSKAACNITVTNAPTGWKQEDSDCYLSGVVVTNATGTALTVGTDYKVYASTGIIQMLNTTSTNTTNLVSNVTLIDYSYCGQGYMADSWGRTVLNTNTGLFSVVLLVGAAAVIYLLLGKKEEDD